MSYATREQYLNAAAQKMRGHFAAKGWTIPDKVRISCGLPSTGAFRTGKRAIGEAWASTASRDQHFEIFISPTIDDAIQVLATLAHELVHVTVGLKAGHRGQFIECARDIGLLGPWTMSKASDELADKIDRWSNALGDYPHRALEKMTTGRKKQTTRLIKCSCDECGYTIRAAMTWILTAVPNCPDDQCKGYGKPMTVDVPQEEQELINV